jgi:hypothetical protein
MTDTIRKIVVLHQNSPVFVRACLGASVSYEGSTLVIRTKTIKDIVKEYQNEFNDQAQPLRLRFKIPSIQMPNCT